MKTKGATREASRFGLFALLVILGMWLGGGAVGVITPYLGGNALVAWLVSIGVPTFIAWILVRRFGKKTVADK